MKTMSSCPEYSRFSALPLEGVIMTEYEYSETYFLSLADFWTRRSYPLITSLLDSRLKSESAESKFASALDLGCGNGIYGEVLHRYAKSVTGSDHAQASVEKCRSLGIYDEITQSDACQLSFESENFDLVFSTEVLEHIEDYEKALQEIARVLKKNGILTLTTTLYGGSIWTYWVASKQEGHSWSRRLKEFFTYLRGYFDSKTQETFIRQWCFEPLGGHYHGFHTRQLAVGIRKAGFGKIRMQPFYAFEPIPILQGGNLGYIMEKRFPLNLALLPVALMVSLLNLLLRKGGLFANNVFVDARKVNPV